MNREKEMSNVVTITLNFRQGCYADGIELTSKECLWLMDGWNTAKGNTENQKLLRRAICSYKGLYYLFLIYSKRGKKDVDDKDVYKARDFRKLINKYKSHKSSDLDKYVLCIDNDGKFHSILQTSEFYSLFFGDDSHKRIP
jgi:hypothetical protein